MLIRNCAGGIVFYDHKVLILKNEKNEWVFPKGVIRTDDSTETIARSRVLLEAGVEADIVSTAGMTNYEFYSVSRQRPVCNRITWFVMEAKSDKCTPNSVQNFSEGGFFPIDKAVTMITYSQDKSLLMVSYQHYIKDKEQTI
ncbi:MAG: NUDIX hydrolase [Eubacteriales bacterium]|nr:NUDIX hydrolase [Eubacteriales bacterium]MDD4717401.1 NUDIX hydrolase [Eubacteriales bacterium]NCU25523.1 NUDIX hydrolase [Candidatus Nomurabacteria bacterium]